MHSPLKKKPGLRRVDTLIDFVSLTVRTSGRSKTNYFIFNKTFMCIIPK